MFKIFAKSNYSLTKPKIPQDNTDNCAYTRISKNVQETREINEKAYKGHEFCLKLDISSFFDSIYTHTISWAIHTKKIAKQHINDSKFLGNKIDKAVTNLNKKQTNGILVGNACSRLISEIILCSIDEEISKKFPEIDVCRYVDDYSIYFTNDSKVNENAILEFIRLKLLEYNLQLNESKIVLLKSPFPSSNKEIEELRSFITNDPYVYINNVLHVFNITNDIKILKYGLKVLNYKINNENFKQIQPILMNLWCNYPSLTEEILNIVFRFKDEIDIQNFKENIINKIFKKCLSYRHDNELIWLLYTCQQLNIHLEIHQIREIFETENDLAIIIILFMEKENNGSEYGLILKELETNLTNIQNVFYSNRWLLAYEIVKNNFIPSYQPQRDAFFNTLEGQKIDFYNEKYKHELQEKQIDAGAFITRDEFNKSITNIYKLIENSSNKQAIKEAIDDLNKKLESVVENKYF